MFFNRGMIKPTAVHTYYGILLSNEKEQIIETCYNMDEPPEDYAEKKPS